MPREDASRGREFASTVRVGWRRIADGQGGCFQGICAPLAPYVRGLSREHSTR